MAQGCWEYDDDVDDCGHQDQGSDAVVDDEDTMRISSPERSPASLTWSSAASKNIYSTSTGGFEPGSPGWGKVEAAPGFSSSSPAPWSPRSRQRRLNLDRIVFITSPLHSLGQGAQTSPQHMKRTRHKTINGERSWKPGNYELVQIRWSSSAIQLSDQTFQNWFLRACFSAKRIEIFWSLVFLIAAALCVNCLFLYCYCYYNETVVNEAIPLYLQIKNHPPCVNPILSLFVRATVLFVPTICNSKHFNTWKAKLSTND